MLQWYSYMGKRKEYIPSPQHRKDMYTNPSFGGMWAARDKVSIDAIKIDKNLFDFQNEVDHKQVLDMLANFDQELWSPILVNERNYLLDGQHRLQVAKQLCLKYFA